jgi:hypothetical protein
MKSSRAYQLLKEQFPEKLKTSYVGRDAVADRKVETLSQLRAQEFFGIQLGECKNLDAKLKLLKDEIHYFETEYKLNSPEYHQALRNFLVVFIQHNEDPKLIDAVLEKKPELLSANEIAYAKQSPAVRADMKKKLEANKEAELSDEQKEYKKQNVKVDSYLDSLWHVLVQYGTVETAQKLWAYHQSTAIAPDVNPFSLRESNEYTPLMTAFNHAAIDNRFLKMFEFVLSQKGQVGGQSSWFNQNVLHCLATDRSRFQEKDSKEAIEKCIDEIYLTNRSLLEEMDNEKRTPLLWALQFNSESNRNVAACLLRHGAKLNAPLKFDGTERTIVIKNTIWLLQNANEFLKKQEDLLAVEREFFKAFFWERDVGDIIRSWDLPTTRMVFDMFKKYKEDTWGEQTKMTYRVLCIKLEARVEQLQPTAKSSQFTAIKTAQPAAPAPNLESKAKKGPGKGSA